MTASEDIDGSAAPLIEHLAELRNRIMYSLGAFVLAMLICFPFYREIFNFLTVPVCRALADQGDACNLVMIKLQEGFFVAIRISVMGGIALSFPIIAYQMWRFVAPGLYRTEKNAFLPFLLASPAMFIIGSTFAYYIVLPLAFRFFLTFQQGGADLGAVAGAVVPAAPGTAGISFQGSMEQYLSLTTSFIMAFGLCFQLPVLLTLMGKAGLITSRGLAATRKYAIVLILLLCAVATPPEMMSQLILFCAIYPLYEVSIFLIRRIEKKREAELRAQGLWFEDDEEDEAEAEGKA